jgi:hypothetical protein
MKKPLILLLLALPYCIFTQEIFVADFETQEAAIRNLMPGVTDVFRSAIAGNSTASLTTRRDSADYIVTGTVTRFGEINPPAAEQTSSVMSGSVNIAVQLFSFAVQGGNKNKNGKSTAYNKDAAEPEVLVYAQIADANTGRVIAASSMHCTSWREYLEKGAALTADFIAGMPLAGILAGSWRGAVGNGAGEDEYLLTFRANNKCTVTVSSRDTWGETRNQTASGTYSYSGEILTLSVNFRDGVVRHVSRVGWKTVPLFAADRTSFSMIIPTTPEQNAPRERVTFWKEQI